ncbi:MAG: ubiquinol-cytochrome C chaperone [Alphaproteobacteria bacterium]|nr:MAG: ubiquinol-cytochrome C chaperone [Alphaproteobacteria bacterium]
MPLARSLFERLRARRQSRRAAFELYAELVRAARRPVFYERYAVADTLDGRFDLIALHLWLLLDRLAAHGQGKVLQRALQEVFFADLDRSLRELGVGDLSVGKRVKRMARAFYGRVKAYEAPAQERDRDALAAALARNLWRGMPPAENVQRALAEHVFEQAAYLARQDDAALESGKVSFLAPPCETAVAGAPHAELNA